MKDLTSEPPVTVHNDLPNSEGIGLLYDSDHNLIGEIHNYYSFLDVRNQIKKKKLSGFYLIKNNQKIMIREDGTISDYPDYKILDHMLSNLVPW